MGRKGKDLFQLLQLREGGKLPTASKRSSDEGIWSRIKAAIPGKDGASSRSKGASGRPPSRSKGRGGAASFAAFQLSGPALAGVVFGCLAVGFLLGRWLAPEAAPEDLSVPTLRTPSEQGLAGDAGRDWGPEREEEVLSKHVLALVRFSASQRQRAADLAAQLREAGFQSARIRRLDGNAGSEWFTLVYTEGEDEDSTRVLRNRLLQIQIDNDDFNTSRANHQGWPLAATL